MGTRGAIIFVIDGAEKVCYNHFDSYPDGLGSKMLSWLQDAVKDLPAVKDSARNLKMVDEDTAPTAEEIAKLAHLSWNKAEHGGEADLREGQQWYDLLHQTQGEPAMILESGYNADAHDFVYDSLFCEWAYVVDLDEDRFEVYRGFQTEPVTTGRWAGKPDKQPEHRVTSAYYAIAPFPGASWKLTELPGQPDFEAVFAGEDE